MPCYATGSAEGDARLMEHEERDLATTLTRLLCKACRAADKFGSPLPTEVNRWWREHQKVDAKRLRELEISKQRRKIANAALKKLTAKERKVLGLVKDDLADDEDNEE